MHDSTFFQTVIEEELKKLSFPSAPVELYEPVSYMLAMTGKRLRPSLVLMAVEVFGGDYQKAIFPALGIEVFHNFTLLHDDIMDKAPLRRSKETVHKKWNADIAILSGDAMFVKASELMLRVDDAIARNVMTLFYRTATEVCEGQQLDMNYEKRDSVSIDEYISMISLKTASLLACSLKTGALVAGTTEMNAELVYDFGKNIGIAFQLHDDMLDVYGDEQKFGKQTGGDIIANKKTFLLLKALETAEGNDLKQLKKWLSMKEFDSQEKIEAMKEVFSSLNIREHSEEKTETFFQQAMYSLDKIDVPEENKTGLKNFAQALMVREV